MGADFNHTEARFLSDDYPQPRPLNYASAQSGELMKTELFLKDGHRVRCEKPRAGINSPTTTRNIEVLIVLAAATAIETTT